SNASSAPIHLTTKRGTGVLGVERVRSSHCSPVVLHERISCARMRFATTACSRSKAGSKSRRHSSSASEAMTCSLRSRIAGSGLCLGGRRFVARSCRGRRRRLFSRRLLRRGGPRRLAAAAAGGELRVDGRQLGVLASQLGVEGGDVAAQA